MEYLKSHPWLKFSADLRAAQIGLWLKLGAAESKIRHIANTLLPPDVSAEMHAVYLAKGVHATTAIEGNTLSEQDVRRIIGGQKAVSASREYQAKEVENLIDACNGILNEVLRDEEAGQSSGHLSVDLIRDFNRQILRDLPLEEGIHPGEIPTHNVVVARYRGAPRRECEFLLGKLCGWINNEIVPPEPHFMVPFAILRATLAHIYLAWIHPFGDGNGRTARLVELQILLNAGVPSVCAHLLSNHYNQTRDEYYRQLDRASRSGGEVLPFVEYAVNGLVEGLTEQIERIDGFQWGATWKEFVHSTFKNKTTKALLRQKQLALDLWKAGTAGRARTEIRHLSTDLAACYAGKEQKTIDRDIAILEQMGMIQMDEGVVRVKFDPLKNSLLPKRRPVEWSGNSKDPK